MPAAALIRFTQGSPGPDGQAVLGVLNQTVTVENVDNSGVASWRIEIAYVPVGSSVPTGVVAQAPSDGTPSANFFPDARGSYRVVLKVWDMPGYIGTPSVDIRVFAIAEPSRGFIQPPAQLLPPPLPPMGSGRPNARPNELNFDGQPNGWAGNVPALLNEVIRQTDGDGSGGGGGSVPPLTRVAFVDQNTAVSPGDQDGSIGKPFSTLNAAVAALPSGGTFLIAPGDYGSEIEFALGNGLWFFVGLTGNNSWLDSFSGIPRLPPIGQGASDSADCFFQNVMFGGNLNTLGSATLSYCQFPGFSISLAGDLRVDHSTLTGMSCSCSSAYISECTLDGGSVGATSKVELSDCTIGSFSPQAATLSVIDCEWTGGNGQATETTVNQCSLDSVGFFTDGSFLFLINCRLLSATNVNFTGSPGSVRLDFRTNYWWNLTGSSIFNGDPATDGLVLEAPFAKYDFSWNLADDLLPGQTVAHQIFGPFEFGFPIVEAQQSTQGLVDNGLVIQAYSQGTFYAKIVLTNTSMVVNDTPTNTMGPGTTIPSGTTINVRVIFMRAVNWSEN